MNFPDLISYRSRAANMICGLAHISYAASSWRSLASTRWSRFDGGRRRIYSMFCSLGQEKTHRQSITAEKQHRNKTKTRIQRNALYARQGRSEWGGGVQDRLFSGISHVMNNALELSGPLCPTETRGLLIYTKCVWVCSCCCCCSCCRSRIGEREGGKITRLGWETRKRIDPRSTTNNISRYMFGWPLPIAPAKCIVTRRWWLIRVIVCLQEREERQCTLIIMMMMPSVLRANTSHHHVHWRLGDSMSDATREHIASCPRLIRMPHQRPESSTDRSIDRSRSLVSHFKFK